MSIQNQVSAQYQGHGASLKNYYPAWLDKLAPDATLEGSMIEGVVVGAEAVRSIVRTIRSLYDWQEHRFAGPYGDNGFLEEYVAEVRGEPIGCVVLVKRNAAGQAQHVLASYRPRNAIVHFARLLAEKYAGTPLAKYFSDGDS
jgi:hypothetical protein